MASERGLGKGRAWALCWATPPCRTQEAGSVSLPHLTGGARAQTAPEAL